jgi:hypothetical protein
MDSILGWSGSDSDYSIGLSCRRVAGSHASNPDARHTGRLTYWDSMPLGLRDRQLFGNLRKRFYDTTVD